MTTQELRTVLYEPAHDILTMRTVIDTLAARGYKLTSDASLVCISESIEVIDGRILLCTAGGETDLGSDEGPRDAAEYASAIADALDKLLGRGGAK